MAAHRQPARRPAAGCVQRTDLIDSPVKEPVLRAWLPQDVFNETRSILEPAGAVAVAGAKAFLQVQAIQKSAFAGPQLAQRPLLGYCR